jgi:hypothetical protein
MYFLAHLFTILYNVSTGTHDDLTYSRLQVYEVHRSIPVGTRRECGVPTTAMYLTNKRKSAV